MIFSAIVILSCLAIAYIWASRGFFSALIHLLCTIVSGAIAFAAWEPLTFAIMGGGDSMVDWSWGLGLALPFAVSLIALRLATNAILPKNVDLDGVSNLVGGGLCGLLAGVITTGIFALSLGYIRLESELMGYRPLTFSNNGSLVRTGGLLFPTDRLTASFYSMMSDSTLRTEENLRKWHPDLADEGPLLRTNFDGGKSRHTHKPDSFEVSSTYTVDGPNLLNDSFEHNAGRRHSFTYADGTQAADGSSVIMGYVVKFKGGATEKSGQVVVGNGQVRLVVQKPDGDSMAVQPLAVNSRADSPDIKYARWRYEGQEPFIATVRGDNSSPMAFEFVVPKNSKPLGLYVKGIRWDVSQMKGGSFTPDSRDRWVTSGGLNSGAAGAAASGGVSKKGTQLAPNLVIGDNVPGNHVFQKDDMQGVNVDDQRKITDGEGRFKLERLASSRNADRTLQVRNLYTPDDQVIVQVKVDGSNREWGFLSTAAANMDLNAAPVLIDENGIAYSPYGYVYETAAELELKLTPSSPITKITDMPVLTPSKPDQKLTLLFRVGRQTKIKMFAVGDKGLVQIDPPFNTSPR